MATEPRVIAVLKSDALGRVELLRAGDEHGIRRVACGGRLPGSRLIAAALLAREARALRSLEGLPGVPRSMDEPAWASTPATDGSVPRAQDVLVRTFLDGEPLHKARELPEDFFQRLEELVRTVHERGVCHNDLHKEQNVVVGRDGRPGLVDFQLASEHARTSRRFASRARDDLRHVHKHLRRYTMAGRGPHGASASGPISSAPPLPRSPTAAVWRRVVKPVYNLVTRVLLDARDGEERRESAGPWPRWTAAVGPRRSGG